MSSEFFVHLGIAGCMSTSSDDSSYVTIEGSLLRLYFTVGPS